MIGIHWDCVVLLNDGKNAGKVLDGVLDVCRASGGSADGGAVEAS